jgi:hypothetical protein
VQNRQQPELKALFESAGILKIKPKKLLKDK